MCLVGCVVETSLGLMHVATILGYLNMKNPAVEFIILDERLRDWGLPEYKTAMSAGMDLHACIDKPIELHPQAPATLIPAGFALHMDYEYMAALILPRSGLGHKVGLVMGNLTGLVDADYQDCFNISAWNRNPAGTDPIVIKPGDRIAQMVFVPILRPTFNVVEKFSKSTERGLGGFGSTGS